MIQYAVRKIFGTQTKPYYLNTIKFAFYIVWCAVKEFATLRPKSGKMLWKWAGWVLKMRHLTRASAMSTRASLNYKLNAAVKESDVLTANSISLVIETFKYVMRER